MAGQPYSRIGRRRPGYWLVAKNGHASIMTGNLPAEGHGFQYYWLGKDAKGAEARLLGAVVKLGLTPSTDSGLFSGAKSMPDVAAANQGPVEVPLAEGGLSGLLHGIPLIALPPSMIAAGTGEAFAGGEAATAETAAAGAAGGSVATKLANSGGALSKLEQAGTIGAALAALLDPKLLTRIVEIVGGVALLLLGLRSLTGIDPTGLARMARA